MMTTSALALAIVDKATEGEFMVYRKSLKDIWKCSSNCGFEDWDIKKVIEHENSTRH